MSRSVAHREPAASRVASSEHRDPVRSTPGFQLFVEPLADGSGPAPRAAADLSVLAVPAGVAHLAPAREPLALVLRRPRAAALVLEPVRVRGAAGARPRLLVLTPAGLRVRLNGRAIPAVALLEVGDQLQLDARAILHVSEFRDGGAVSPGPELVGRPCGVCRLPLTPGTRVHVCRCGLPLHLEGPPVPAEERLECALLGCPSCGSEPSLESGHVWLPELQ